MIQKKILTRIKFYQGILLGICLAIGLSVIAFSEPSQTAPDGNVPAPINVSGTAQTKSGNLSVGNLILDGAGDEGNVTSVNVISGFNDLFLKGNSLETAPVYITGSDIHFYTNGTEKLTIVNNGNVGIGTLIPQAALHIIDTNSFPNGVLIERNSGSPTQFDTPRLGLVDTSLGSISSAPAWYIDNNKDTFRIFRQPNITTPGAAYFQVTANGIKFSGTDFSWGAALDLDAQKVTGGNTWRLASTGGDAVQGQGKFVIYNQSKGYTALTVSEGFGVLGIGTTNPEAPLHIRTATAWGTALDLDARETPGGGGRQWRLASTGGNASQGPGKFVIHDQNSNTTWLTIDASGNVNAPGQLCIRGDCKTSWPAGGGPPPNIVYFVVGNDSNLYYMIDVLTGWIQSPGGCCITQVAATYAVDGTAIYIIARGTDGNIYKRVWFTRSGWTGWSATGGATPATPAATLIRF